MRGTMSYGIIINGPLRIGGYASHECTETDPVVDGREGSTLHWVIPRQDLAERRFDRVHVSFFWNP
ncbi:MULTISPECIES: hypothetical protein [Streptomyces]|uniref:hypothetical protein n=1 Tax=Streptomyces TaxID=1883 RepID=UPI00292F8C3E|nr:hypothetical protein [Streptomyces sp. NEAU-HV9]